MMALVLALTTFGVLMIYSADQIQTTRASGVIHYQRQLLWLIFSVIGLVVVSAFSSRVVETVSYFTYGLLLIGLIGGLGLTVALFVAGEAFTDPLIQGAAKMGALFSAGCGIIAIIAGKLMQVRRRP